jgi:hypothetical protein
MVEHPVIPETVGQYTGLKDKNGVKIFEGDILHYRYKYTGYDDNSSVYWYKKHACFYWGDGNTFAHSDEISVVGNIHDNPELVNRE